MEIFRKVGLDGYFGLEPWGIDIQRAYELMTTINKEGVATLSMPEGETVQVQIFEDLISEALHLHIRCHITSLTKKKSNFSCRYLTRKRPSMS